MYNLQRVTGPGLDLIQILKSANGVTNYIPIQETNSDYQEYLDWCTQGNVAEMLPEQKAVKQLTPLDVIKLFTRQENLAIVTATMTIPEAKMWYDRLLAATYITIEDPDTAAGLEIMVQAGLLTAERRTAILQAIQDGVVSS